MTGFYKYLRESPRYWDVTHGPFTEGHCKHAIGYGYNYIRDIDGDYYAGRSYLVFQGEGNPKVWEAKFEKCLHCGRELQEIDFMALHQDDLDYYYLEYHNAEKIDEYYNDLREKYGWKNAPKDFTHKIDISYLKRIEHGFAKDEIGREW